MPRAIGVEEIFFPGEIEARAEETGRVAGVTLPDQTVSDLRTLGESCGLSFDHIVLEVVA